MRLFEVVHKDTNEVYTVYDVKPTQGMIVGHSTLFLIYRNDDWVWASAKYYKPKY